MATKSKTSLGRIEFQSKARFKKTKQGHGRNSRPKRGQKMYRGQGK
jgi:hypothetical protein